MPFICVNDFYVLNYFKLELFRGFNSLKNNHISWVLFYGLFTLHSVELVLF